MPQAKPSIVRPLRSIAALSVAGPALVFAYASWTTHTSIDHRRARTTERIESALDVIQEHALKAIQTVERTIAETNEVLRGLSDKEIRAEQTRLSQRLKRTQDALPQIQSIWAFDLASSPHSNRAPAPV